MGRFLGLRKSTQHLSVFWNNLNSNIFDSKIWYGEVAEWFKAHAWKACGRRKASREFESLLLRHDNFKAYLAKFPFITKLSQLDAKLFEDYKTFRKGQEANSTYYQYGASGTQVYLVYGDQMGIR
jgi:hypothetical protein